MKRALRNGIEVDDAKDRIDRVEVHRFLSEVAYWALGRTRERQDLLIVETVRHRVAKSRQLEHDRSDHAAAFRDCRSTVGQKAHSAFQIHGRCSYHGR